MSQLATQQSKQIGKKNYRQQALTFLGNIFSLAQLMYYIANNSLWSGILQPIMSLQVVVKYYCSDLCLPFNKRENFGIYPTDHGFILEACEMRTPIIFGSYIPNPSYLGLPHSSNHFLLVTLPLPPLPHLRRAELAPTVQTPCCSTW